MSALDTNDLGMVPIVIETSGRGERAYDIYSRLLRERVIFHQPSGVAQGQATDIEIHAREILKTREQLNKIYAERTGQPIEKIRADMERDFFMDPEESKSYGLIDQVLAHRAAAAVNNT